MYAREQLTSQRTFDKSILFLSGGSFGVTFAFLGMFIGDQPTHAWLVILGWALISTSLVTQLTSHLTSHKAFERAIDRLDKDENAPGDIFSTITHCLNYASITAFAVGMASILIFISINFR